TQAELQDHPGPAKASRRLAPEREPGPSDAAGGEIRSGLVRPHGPGNERQGTLARAPEPTLPCGWGRPPFARGARGQRTCLLREVRRHDGRRAQIRGSGAAVLYADGEKTGPATGSV